MSWDAKIEVMPSKCLYQSITHSIIHVFHLLYLQSFNILINTVNIIDITVLIKA